MEEITYGPTRISFKEAKEQNLPIYWCLIPASIYNLDIDSYDTVKNIREISPLWEVKDWKLEFNGDDYIMAVDGRRYPIKNEDPWNKWELIPLSTLLRASWEKVPCFFATKEIAEECLNVILNGIRKRASRIVEEIDATRKILNLQ